MVLQARSTGARRVIGFPALAFGAGCSGPQVKPLPIARTTVAARQNVPGRRRPTGRPRQGTRIVRPVGIGYCTTGTVMLNGALVALLPWLSNAVTVAL